MTASIATLLAEARAASLPILEARMLLEHVSGLNRTQQAARPERELDETASAAFRQLIARRQAGEPIAYLLGSREFFSLSFKVSPAVLIPRPETELLVELALARVPLDQPSKAIDLGTGSGAIAVSIRHHRPQLNMTALDVSPDALAIAKQNAEQLNTPIRFLQSDWYTAVAGEQFDLIVSNPPYIAHSDHHLGQGDLRFEPVGALTDHADGLSHIRRIVGDAPRHLNAGGWLLFEHGYDQAEACRDILRQTGFSEVASWRDLADIERVTGGRWR